MSTTAHASIVPRASRFYLGPLLLALVFGGTALESRHYSFIPIVLGGAALLEFRRRDAIDSTCAGGGIASWLLLSITWLFLIAAVLQESASLAGYAFVAGLAGWSATSGGFARVRAHAGVLAVMALCVPLPFRWDQPVLHFFSNHSARWAGYLADLLGIPNVVTGAFLEYPGGQLNSNGLYSGFHSPFALAAVAALIAVAARVGWIRFGSLVGSSVAFSIPLGALFLGLSAAAHDSLVGRLLDPIRAGLVFWGALVLALSIDQILSIPTAVVLRPYQPPDEAGPPLESPPKLPGPRRIAVWCTSTTCLLVAAGLQALPLLARGNSVASAPPPLRLPPQIGNWVREESGGRDIQYRNGRLHITINAIDGASAWDAAARRDGSQSSGGGAILEGNADGAAVGFRRWSTEQPTHVFDAVWISGRSRDNQWVANGRQGTVWQRLNRQFARKPGAGDVSWYLRLTMESSIPFSAREMQSGEWLFLQICAALAGDRGSGTEGDS